MNQYIVYQFGEQRLQLFNGQYIRAMTWGSDWNEVRLSARLSLYAPRVAGSLGCYGHFALGLCYGYEYAVGHAWTTSFIGWWIGQKWRITDEEFLYNSSPSAFVTDWSGNHQYAVRKEGTTFDYEVIHNSDGSAVIASKETSRSVVMVQITKGDPNYTIKRWTMSLADAAADISAEAQIEQLIAEVPDAGLFVNHSVAMAAPGYVPDHVNFFWTNQVHPMEVSDIYLVKRS